MSYIPPSLQNACLQRFQPDPHLLYKPQQDPSSPLTAKSSLLAARHSCKMTASHPPSSASIVIISKCTVCPDQKFAMGSLRLSVSDLSMLSCHYIQKGLFFPPPPLPITPLLTLLNASLSHALSFFPARRPTDSADGAIYISCLLGLCLVSGCKTFRLPHYYLDFSFIGKCKWCGLPLV